MKAASSAEDAHVKLAQAIRDTACGNMVALTPRINAADASMTKFGYSNTQVQEALRGRDHRVRVDIESDVDPDDGRESWPPTSTSI